MCMQPFVKFLLCSFWYLQKFHLKRTELSSATRGWSRWRIVGGGRWRKVFISFRDTFVPWLSIKKRERRLKACTTSCALAMTTWTHINGAKEHSGLLFMQISELLCRRAGRTANSKLDQRVRDSKKKPKLNFYRSVERISAFAMLPPAFCPTLRLPTSNPTICVPTEGESIQTSLEKLYVPRWLMPTRASEREKA